MVTKSTQTRQGVQLTLSSLLAALCLAAAPAAGGARAAGSLDAFGDGVELRLVDARTGAVPAALDRVDLATLLPSLGAPDRGPASLAAPALDSTA